MLIHDADEPGQTFGQVVDTDTGKELMRFDLTEKAAHETDKVFGELYRYEGAWKFCAVGLGLFIGLGGHRS